jgi:AraC-like DNA-binding protein
MKTQAKHAPRHPSGVVLPSAIYFRAESIPAAVEYPSHHHAWGELVYAFTGVMEVKLADHHYLAPPQYAIWLPPHVQHTGLNRQETSFCSVYIAAELCGRLPQAPCAITVSALVRAMLEHLRDHPPGAPRSEEEERLLRVLLDQLGESTCAGSYLPTSDDLVLGPVLRELEAQPGDTRPLSALARAAGTTERTLMRRCQRDLGMSFTEWRQRLRVVKAMPLLDAGHTVESVAFDLGYGSASAFIVMFRRMTGVTPVEFRRGGGHGGPASGWTPP